MREDRVLLKRFSPPPFNGLRYESVHLKTPTPPLITLHPSLRLGTFRFPFWRNGTKPILVFRFPDSLNSLPKTVCSLTLRFLPSAEHFSVPVTIAPSRTCMVFLELNFYHPLHDM